MREEIPNWVMYDDKHVMDTNTGRIVLLGKQHDYTREDIKGYDKLDKEKLWDILELAYSFLCNMPADSEAKTIILREIDSSQRKVRELI